jgi:hypothetical protein
MTQSTFHAVRYNITDPAIENDFLDDRRLQAIDTATTYGKGLVYSSWLAHELETMRMRHATGVLVNKRYARASTLKVMAWIQIRIN